MSKLNIFYNEIICHIIIHFFLKQIALCICMCECVCLYMYALPSKHKTTNVVLDQIGFYS